MYLINGWSIEKDHQIFFLEILKGKQASVWEIESKILRICIRVNWMAFHVRMVTYTQMGYRKIKELTKTYGKMLINMRGYLGMVIVTKHFYFNQFKLILSNKIHHRSYIWQIWWKLFSLIHIFAKCVTNFHTLII